MEGSRKLWLAVPRHVRRVPADLAAVVAGVVLTGLLLVLPVVRGTPLAYLFGFPFALFLPGYATVAALFPERGELNWNGDGRIQARTDRTISGIERAVLSFALSIGITPILGMLLVLWSVELEFVAIYLVVSGYTVGVTVIGAARRWRLPENERFRVPYDRWARTARTTLGSVKGGNSALNGLLVVSLLLALSSVGYAVAVHEQGRPYTEFYLVTENETGALVADGYPTDFRRGQQKSVTVVISNHEREPVEYSVVVLLQRVAVENGKARVVTSRRLDTFQTYVAAGATNRRRHQIRPTVTGERLRLQYLLYKGEVPQDPTRRNAYRQVHLWVNVTADTTTDRGPPGG